MEMKKVVDFYLKNIKDPGSDKFQTELIKTMTPEQIRVLQQWINEVLAKGEMVTKVTEKEMSGTKEGQRPIRSPTGSQLSYSTLPTSLLYMSLTNGSRKWLSIQAFSCKTKEVFVRTRAQTSTTASYTT